MDDDDILVIAAAVLAVISAAGAVATIFLNETAVVEHAVNRRGSKTRATVRALVPPNASCTWSRAMS
jgi:hypothetical protein